MKYYSEDDILKLMRDVKYGTYLDLYPNTDCEGMIYYQGQEVEAVIVNPI